MKIGDVRSEEAMQLILNAREYETGLAFLKHPRNGRVVFKRVNPTGEIVQPLAGGIWRVTECERPDP